PWTKTMVLGSDNSKSGDMDEQTAMLVDKLEGALGEKDNIHIFRPAGPGSNWYDYTFTWYDNERTWKTTVLFVCNPALTGGSPWAKDASISENGLTPPERLGTNHNALLVDTKAGPNIFYYNAFYNSFYHRDFVYKIIFW
ncbi:unnamed protein product, partial [marine sediment metagenome]